MDFNFGSKPFKFAVPPNFVAVNDAPSNYVSSNTSGTSAPALDHLVSNAPLALIIEVWIFFPFMEIHYLKLLIQLFKVKLL